MTLTSRLRDLFTMRWVPARLAASTLARKGAEKRRQTLQERQKSLHARLAAERDAGLVCGKPR